MFRDLILTHDVFLVEDEESDEILFGPQFCGRDIESGGGSPQGIGFGYGVDYGMCVTHRGRGFGHGQAPGLGPGSEYLVPEKGYVLC